MKKVLLSLIAVAASAFLASAETVTFDFANNDYGLTRYSSGSTYITDGTKVENGDATITFSHTNTGTTSWRLWTDGLRATKTVVGEMAITVANSNITAVEVEVTNYATNIAVNGGTAEAVTKGSTFKWSGDEAELKLVYTQGGTLCIPSITITYEVVDPSDTREPAGLAWSENSVTVRADKLADFTAPTLTNPNDVDVTYASDNTEVAAISEAGAVTLSGTVGSATITASFAGNTDYKPQDVTYIINVEPAPVVVSSIEETKALATNTTIQVSYPLTVAFVNFNNVFACDEAGNFIQLYGTNSLKVGDVIPAGWEGTYTLYQSSTPEITFTEGALPAATEGTFTPAVVPAADITTELVNHVVTIKNVDFDAATPSTKANFTGNVGETELSFRNNYALESVEAGKYDVTVVVTIYQNAPSLYVVSYAKSETDGVLSVEAADNAAPVEYYNLQGVRVDNPANGIFIRRQGSKAQKIVL